MANIWTTIDLLKKLKDKTIQTAGTATLTSANVGTVNVGMSKIELIMVSMESTDSTAAVTLTGKTSSTDNSVDFTAVGSDGTTVIHYLVEGKGAR